MVKFILFGGFSVLIAFYLCAVSSDMSHKGFLMPWIPFIGCGFIAVASGCYLRDKNKLGTLLALLGLGFTSNSLLWPYLMIPGLLSLGYKHLLFLLPGLGSLILYYISIKQYLQPEVSQFEFFKSKVGKVEKDILVYVPAVLVVIIGLYFIFSA
jgi:hypothetical protein